MRNEIGLRGFRYSHKSDRLNRVSFTLHRCDSQMWICFLFHSCNLYWI